jgi:hypothetical protein
VGWSEEEEEERIRRAEAVDRLLARAQRLIAYKYMFFSRRTYLVGRIDEKLDRIADELGMYGVDGRRLIRELEERLKLRYGWR